MSLNPFSKNTSLEHLFHKFPLMKVGNLVLRELIEEDAEAYYSILTNLEVSRYLSDEDIPKSLEDARSDIIHWRESFYRRSSIFWVIANAEDNKMLGTVGYMSWNFYNRRAEVCYELDHKYWRQGIMTGVLSAVLDYGVRQMQLHRITARTMLGNVPSQRLLAKMHFRREGIERSYRFIRGKFEDIALFSLLSEDWPKV